MSFCEQRSIKWLERDFGARKLQNPKYSVRAYARVLSVSSGALSQYFNGLRKLTNKQAQKMADNLELDYDSRQDFLGEEEEAERQGALSQPEYRQVHSDTFKLISDWQHYAILSLLETDDPPQTVKEIAARLCTPEAKINAALQRLKRLEFIRSVDGQLVVDTEGLTTTHDIASAAIQQAHLQHLDLAQRALLEIEPDQRDSTSIIFTMDPSEISKAKKLLMAFRRKFAKTMEKTQKKQVYSLTMHLIPLSKKK